MPKEPSGLPRPFGLPPSGLPQHPCISNYELRKMTQQKAYYDQVYRDCINFCISGDLICLAGCSRKLNFNLRGCPCQVGCPNGCPCKAYVCPTTTPSITTTTITTTSTTTTTTRTTTTSTPSLTQVLILNTGHSNNVPLITNSSGYEDRNINFQLERDTQVYHSCGLTYRGEHFIFGGSSKTTQIAKIDGCQLRTIGQLTFNHYRGACANVAEEQVYLCFNTNSWTDHKKCRKAPSPLSEFEETQESAVEHTSTRIAASQSKPSYFDTQGSTISFLKSSRRNFGAGKLFESESQDCRNL